MVRRRSSLVAVAMLLSFASVAVGAPVEAAPEGIAIPLKRRASRMAMVVDGVVNIEAHTAARAALAAKHGRNADNYERNAGRRIDRPRMAKFKTSSPKALNAQADAHQGPELSSSGHARMAKRQRERLTDYEQSETLWTGKVLIGTPPRPYSISFDTGSADLWVDSKTIVDGYPNFDPAGSSTAVNKSGLFQVVYGDGSNVSGPIYTDVVTVAGVSVSSQYFSPVTQTSPDATYGEDQGLMGMGPQTISRLAQRPYFMSLVSAKKFRHNLFSLALRTSGSELLLGRFDPTQFIGTLTYSPVVLNQGWIVTGSVFVNQQLSNPNVDILVDSGTSLIAGPTADVAHFFSLIPGARESADTPGQYEALCPILAAYDFNVGFAGDGPSKRFRIPGPKLILGTSPSDPTYCISALTAFDFGEWIFGDTFLLEVYTVFNVDRNAIGFAPMKPL